MIDTAGIRSYGKYVRVFKYENTDLIIKKLLRFDIVIASFLILPTSLELSTKLKVLLSESNNCTEQSEINEIFKT